MRIAHDVTELVGRTPLVQLNRIPQAEGCLGRIVMKLAKISFYGFLTLIISLLLILSFVNASKAQSDTAVRSELISLRNRVERLESQVRGISIRGENAAPIPQRRSGTGIVNGEVVGESDPLFQRLATLVIEIKEDLKKLEQRVQVLEKETVSQKS